MTEPERTCTKHAKPLKFSRKLKTWYCPDCLLAAHLTHQAQQEAVKRYRESDKGKEAQKRYEQGKGKDARQRYLKSGKYKERRKEYNQRIKESLQIARAARVGAPRMRKVVKELPPGSPPIIADILEYQEMVGRSPSPTDVKEWSQDIYKKQITTAVAQKLIGQAEDLPPK